MRSNFTDYFETITFYIFFHLLERFILKYSNLRDMAIMSDNEDIFRING